MKRKEQDRHLQSPGEANRDKHINFAAIENGDRDPADAGRYSNNLHLTSDSSLQSPEEERIDKGKSPSQDRDISVSNDDLTETKGDTIARNTRNS